MVKHFNFIDYCLVLVGRKTETSSGELHTGPDKIRLDFDQVELVAV